MRKQRAARRWRAARDYRPILQLWIQSRRADGFPWVPEHPFAEHLGRRWRFDYALLDPMAAFEIDGVVWSAGRHVRGAGFIADLEKLNTAAALGWKVLRFVPAQIVDGSAFTWLERLEHCDGRFFNA